MMDPGLYSPTPRAGADRTKPVFTINRDPDLMTAGTANDCGVRMFFHNSTDVSEGFK
jgi:hypothetical protein